MKIKKLISSNGYDFEGPLIINPEIYEDKRGYFYESWNHDKFNRIIKNNYKKDEVLFVQDNHSFSEKGVLRGMHFQIYPKEQGKLVRCISGEIFDVIIDLRLNSATFSCWGKVKLSKKNKKQLWIPPGFAHGFLTISAKAEVLYKTTEFWFKEYERTIKWNDKSINIKWPKLKCEKIISNKDNDGLSFRNFLEKEQQK